MGHIIFSEKAEFSRVAVVVSYRVHLMGKAPLTPVIGAQRDTSMSMPTTWEFLVHYVRLWIMT